MLQAIPLDEALINALTPWAWISLSVGLLGAAWMMLDLRSRPPHMEIMRWVWPLAALWGSAFGIALYLLAGRASRADKGGMTHTMSGMNMPGMKMDAMPSMSSMPTMAHGSGKPFWLRVGAGTAHCGAGCSLADMVGGWWFFFLPWTLAGSTILGEWVGEYVLALLFGVGFQYAAIQPMLHLPTGQAIARAFKVDFISLTAWQVGMYGFMALVFFRWVGRVPSTEVAFWLLMQGAMISGFFCSYLANWWLIRAGIKPAM